jgi:ubiquitin-protein ligase
MAGRRSMGAMWKTPRTLRLERDHDDMRRLKKESSILEFEVRGDPPDGYRALFRAKSLVPSGKEGGAELGDRQELEVSLGAEYPRIHPNVRWLTPILHPNIFSQGVCFGHFGSQWTPYYRLVDFFEVMYDYSRLAILNPYSAGPGGRPELEVWSALDRRFGFPVDKRPLRDKVLGKDAGSSVVRQAPGDPDDVVIMPEDPGECP